ncbi:unnamed protein product [Linum trigynum]|uniref:Uncharacterized protein n=1 Tax=Linum trigynum TaxID=586398 RepID=A0AAV2DEC1_9ROSI
MANSKSSSSCGSPHSMSLVAVVIPRSSQSLSLYLNFITISTQSLVTGPRLLSHGMPRIRSNPCNGSIYRSSGINSPWIITGTPTSFSAHRSGAPLATFTSKDSTVDLGNYSRFTNSVLMKLREAPLSTRATPHSPMTCTWNLIVADPAVSTAATAEIVSTPPPVFSLRAVGSSSSFFPSARATRASWLSPASTAAADSPAPSSSLAAAAATLASALSVAVAIKGMRPSDSTRASPIATRSSSSVRASRANTPRKRSVVDLPRSPQEFFAELMSNTALIPIVRNTAVVN